MPLKPSYLALAGAGGIVIYAGVKGLGLSSAIRQVISGKSPATATPSSAQIQSASYSMAAQSFGYGGGASIPSTSTTGTGQAPGTTTAAGRGSGGGTTAPGAQPKGGMGTLSTTAAKALGFVMVVAAGWGRQWSDFNNVVMAESGWRTTVHFGGGLGYVPGLAYGIPQALPGDKMASAGSNWQTSSYTQIKWMIGYIRSVYGDPAHAWAHEQAVHWY